MTKPHIQVYDGDGEPPKATQFRLNAKGQLEQNWVAHEITITTEGLGSRSGRISLWLPTDETREAIAVLKEGMRIHVNLTSSDPMRGNTLWPCGIIVGKISNTDNRKVIIVWWAIL